MKLSPDCVYIARQPVDGDEAPFEDYRQLAHNALDGLELDLPATGDICLKPNATVLNEPAKRIIVHPGFLAGMLESLAGRGIDPARLIVGDGQSGEYPDRGHTWAISGYTEAIEDRGAVLMPYNDAPVRDVVVEGGVVYDRYPIYTAVTDSSFFFNIPLAKCHNLGVTTLTIKNLMGILGRPERHLCAVQEVDEPLGEEALWRLGDSGYSVFEERFYHKLCDLLIALRSLEIPRLSVVDGLIGRDGTAFNEGANYPLGWSLVGVDEVKIDTVGTWLMGLDPLQTPYLQFAAERGLGTIRMDEIDVVDLATGDKLDLKALEEIRVKKPLMPLCRVDDGYYPRFRADGTPVPWRIGQVNLQRKADGLEPVAYETAVPSGDAG
ncbi:MAG: DUF362 domain-containing protein [Gemmatimonadetes bacterium]|jgi:uncharacterized protein (DUF362 family)|nr:DUF362 domain-containing protein [Gemmatimonadota bacterium]